MERKSWSPREPKSFANIFSLGAADGNEKSVIFVHGKLGRTWAKKRVHFLFFSLGEGMAMRERCRRAKTRRDLVKRTAEQMRIFGRGVTDGLKNQCTNANAPTDQTSDKPDLLIMKCAIWSGKVTFGQVPEEKEGLKEH